MSLEFPFATTITRNHSGTCGTAGAYGSKPTLALLQNCANLSCTARSQRVWRNEMGSRRLSLDSIENERRTRQAPSLASNKKHEVREENLAIVIRERIFIAHSTESPK